MADQSERIAELIADKLKNGLVHPGDRKKGIKPTPIALPFGSRPGMPKEMANLSDGIVKLIGEAVVSTIEVEGDCEIIDRTEARELRMRAGNAPIQQMLPVYCHCGAQEPLMILTVTNPDRVVVDGTALISGLARRRAACPHDWNT